MSIIGRTSTFCDLRTMQEVVGCFAPQNCVAAVTASEDILALVRKVDVGQDNGEVFFDIVVPLVHGHFVHDAGKVLHSSAQVLNVALNPWTVISARPCVFSSELPLAFGNSNPLRARPRA